MIKERNLVDEYMYIRCVLLSWFRNEVRISAFGEWHRQERNCHPHS